MIRVGHAWRKEGTIPQQPRQVVGGFEVFRSNATAVGQYNIIEPTANRRRVEADNVSIFTAGRARHFSLDGTYEREIVAGETSWDLPDLQVGKTLRIETLTPDFEMFCVRRLDLGVVQCTKFTGAAGEQVVVPQGKIAVVVGATDKGEGPFIVHAETQAVTVTFVGPGFGAIFG